MTITVSDFGVWVKYAPNPDNPPQIPGADYATIPPAVLFSKGPSGDDWYVFRATWPPNLLVALVNSAGVVGSVVRNVMDSAVPFNMRVLGIAGHDPADLTPWKAYEGKIYDPQAKTFAAPASPSSITYKADIWRRMTSDEATAIYADLQDADVKMRATFEAAQYIDHSDDLFPLLLASISARTGSERAAVILAPS